MRSARRPEPLIAPSTDGVTVEIHDLGGIGHPLLLAHATGFHGLVWTPLFAHLHGFHGWAPDLRGHGSSSAPQGGDFTWSGFADDVLAVVDAIESDEPLYGIGHSKGGAALLLAEQQRPGTFRSLYLFEPVVFPPAFAGFDGENPLAAGARRRRDQFPSREVAYENYAAKPPFSQLHPDALMAYVQHGFADAVADEGEAVVELTCRPENEAAIYEMGGQHDAFEHLGEVRCPVVVAAGGRDLVGPAAFAPAIVDALPSATLETFAALGHFGPLEDPAAVAASIQRTFTS